MKSGNPENKAETYEELVRPPETHFPDHLNDQECLELPYSVLQRFNEQTREELEAGKDEEFFKKKFLEFLKSEEGIKAIQLYYPSIEGKLHKFEYDREYFLGSHDSLTFDGSSIKGYSEQENSDLRLKPVFSQFFLAPHRSFGSGTMVGLAAVFNTEEEKEGGQKPYKPDFTNMLIEMEQELKERGLEARIAPEIEGFLLEGQYAEQKYPNPPFQTASESGYAGAAAGDELIDFINELAREERAMAYKNEKDHPEVAAGQFELNYQPAGLLRSAFLALLHRQMAVNLAHRRGKTASFLPKPNTDVNGSGMHTNISLRETEGGKNIFHDAEGKFELSEKARKFIGGILKYGKEISLAYNITSANGSRRNDPSKEAPIDLIADGKNRAAVIRVPHHTEKSARVEVRATASDAHPGLAFGLLVRAGLKGMLSEGDEAKEYLALAEREKKEGEFEQLPTNFHEAIELFEKSEFAREAMGEEAFQNYLAAKKAAADRVPRNLGKSIKEWEVKTHPLVTNHDLEQAY